MDRVLPYPEWCRDGARVWYVPPRTRHSHFAATVHGGPWQIPGGQWVVDLRDLDECFRAAVRNVATLTAVPLHTLREHHSNRRAAG